MNVIVTGGSRGIGLELCLQFAKEGHTVYLLSRNAAKVESVLAYSNIVAIPFDLTSKTDINAFGARIETQGLRFDALIHNAGVLIKKPFSDITITDFETVYKTNVFGVAELTQKVLPYLNKGGHVLAISSVGGIQGSAKFPGLSAYSSSKAALIGLMETLAQEYQSQGIAFNTLALGSVQTDMLQEAFPGYKAKITASQMAGYIYGFACSDYKFYNGKTLQVALTNP